LCRVEQEEKDLSKAIDQEIEEKRQLLLELSRGKVSWKAKHKNSFLHINALRGGRGGGEGEGGTSCTPSKDFEKL
jgi:hypothetical protein